MNDTVKKEINKGLAKGMSLREIARRGGVSESVVSSWYSGRYMPSLKHFEAVKAGIKAYKDKKPKNPPCIVERMFQECGINVQFVDVKEVK